VFRPPGRLEFSSSPGLRFAAPPEPRTSRPIPILDIFVKNGNVIEPS
jgi:hypothetical protein